jgi:hypothetical protein
VDLLLDINSNDLDVTTGDLQLTSGAEGIAQHIRIRLRFFLAEWFLDTRLGIPYFQRILVKNPGTAVVRSILRDVIVSTPGVASMNNFVTDYVGATRTLSVAFTAITTDDEPLEFTEEFII